MASTVPLVLEYAYILFRFKINMQQNSSTSSATLCRYGDTKDVFPIGGLADFGGTLIAAGSSYYRRLDNFVLKPHDHLCLFRVPKGLKYCIPLRISFYILDVKAECLIMLNFWYA